MDSVENWGWKKLLRSAQKNLKRNSDCFARVKVQIGSAGQPKMDGAREKLKGKRVEVQGCVGCRASWGGA